MKRNIIAAIKYVLIIMATCALVFFTSCTGCSKSGRDILPPAVNVEKVVIIDRVYTPISYSGGDPIYRYKVKRIEKGVVDFIDLDYLFDVNDTILYQFWNEH
jgi:hypothetical protein